MTMLTPQTEERLRQAFKQYLNPFMRAVYRLGLAKWFQVWPAFSGNILILTHTGRKTGLKRFQPLNYAILDGDIYCTAGFGGISDWYRNLRANPSVEVWLPDGWWAGIAEDISDSPDRIDLLRQVMIGSGFAAYAFGINPYQMTDEEIRTACEKYRLVRIRRTTPRTGPGGPGELSWVWPLTTFLLLGLLLSRRPRR